MSSRSQDSAKLDKLAVQYQEMASLLLRLTEFLTEAESRLSELTSQVSDLEEEVDRINRG